MAVAVGVGVLVGVGVSVAVAVEVGVGVFVAVGVGVAVAVGAGVAVTTTMISVTSGVAVGAKGSSLHPAAENSTNAAKSALYETRQLIDTGAVFTIRAMDSIMEKPPHGQVANC